MCGIFGVINPKSAKRLIHLSDHARQRGRDSSGLVIHNEQLSEIYKADEDIIQLRNKIFSRRKFKNLSLIAGHSRLITNGLNDNQPVIYEDIIILHNGIITNHDEVWNTISKKRHLEIDTEIIGALTKVFLESNTKTLDDLGEFIFSKLKGTISCAIILPKIGKLILFSNNGSLYWKKNKGQIEFSSEKFPLVDINSDIFQILNNTKVFDIVKSKEIEVKEFNSERLDLIPKFNIIEKEKELLKIPDTQHLKRCNKCILPETMPFISFNEEGVCNYCENYRIVNNPKPIEELFHLLEPYRRPGNEKDCLVPFSGGRDSAFGLHLMVKDLKLKPITYTYDWGMVTDLGRRNISRMCSELGVENIIVAADIQKKRRNIKMNIKAWLKNPDLGMVNLFMAGDKHFFRHIETIKKQTGISMNMWSVNPLEVTHFKAGFLGIPPYFEENKVYTNGISKQIRYQSKRFRAMMKSPGYFNSSIPDTLLGEYYRSFHKKEDYFHLFDYYRWEEGEVNDTIIGEYEWEKAVDTTTTWRIGDGTAAFYNYIYYLVAGFTEHDTFRSNQIREGQIDREKALKLVEIENRPRYENIKWYLDAVGLDFEETIRTINGIEQLF